MMTSSNGNIFRDTGPLWGEYTGESSHVTWMVLTLSISRVYHTIILSLNHEFLVDSCHLFSLQWRHNERDGVSNHWRLDFLLNSSGAVKRKTPKLRVIGLCEGNPSATGGFPLQRASYAVNVSTWWRHHAPFYRVFFRWHCDNHKIAQVPVE